MDSRELLAAIDPSLNPAYSPNLHSFSKAWMRRATREMPEVWREDATGYLYFGTMYQDSGACFVGSPLRAVLNNGARENKNRLAYIGFTQYNMTHMADFWERYLKIGRCAIDEDHTIHFINSENRYSMDGDIRTCNWCGAKHQRTVETKIIEEHIERFTPFTA